MKKHNKLIVFMVFALIACIFAAGSVSAADNVGTNVTNTTGLANSSSPEYQINNNHTGQSEYEGPKTNTTQWTNKDNITISSDVSIGPDGTIYAMSRYGTLYAVDHNGNTLWSHSFGDYQFDTPSIGNDGTIYVTLTNGSLYAISPKGKLIWNTALDGCRNSNSPTIGPDGTIYITSGGGKLYAVNSKNGAINWTYNGGGATYFAPSIGSDGTIYFTGNGVVYAVSSDGKEKWKCTIGSTFQSSNSPSIGPDGTIYVGSYEGNLCAINPTTGKIKWTYATGNSVTGTPAISSNGTIYVISTDEYFNSALCAITDKGTTAESKWTYDINPCASGYSAVIGSDGTIYIGTYNFFELENSALYAISPNGDLIWSYAICCGANPVIGPDGTLYIGGVAKDEESNLYGTLYAFKDPDTVAPTVTDVDPANNAVNVPTNKTIKVKFSEPIKAGSYWIELKDSTGKAVDFTKSINENVLTITPTSNLKGTKYTLILHTGSLTDLAGNKLALYTSTFKAA